MNVYTVENGTINFDVFEKNATNNQISLIADFTSDFPDYDITINKDKLSITIYKKKIHNFIDDLQKIIDFLLTIGINVTIVDITSYDKEDNQLTYNLVNGKIVSNAV